MKANLNAYFVMKFSHKSKLKDIPSRNIEESNIVKKKDSVKKWEVYKEIKWNGADELGCQGFLRRVSQKSAP